RAILAGQRQRHDFEQAAFGHALSCRWVERVAIANEHAFFVDDALHPWLGHRDTSVALEKWLVVADRGSRDEMGRFSLPFRQPHDAVRCPETLDQMAEDAVQHLFY